MKPSALFTTAIFATSASAIGPASPGAAPQAARPAGKPAPTENWKWASTSPFQSAALKTKFAPWSCAAEQTFRAREFLLDDLSELPPLGIKPFREALKLVFADRHYPGSWDGIDPHGYDRDLLVMDYAQVPRRVRAWIEEQERSEGKGKGLFAVYEKPVGEAEPTGTVNFNDEEEDEDRKADEGRVVVFAPGALWEVLPLWVAEESACPDALLDITKYSAELADGKVVAWPINKTKAQRNAGEREIEFTIRAQVLEAAPVESAEKEEL
ncbi:hypothetical protein B0T22DRAFT_539808 [Podospora appendiculata]|uniref:Uncharacterized protein n=1 Tax=Podospora appendiculata TaxID=314037 RepID=A0AAE0X1N2_9PEZI|nr:hypothetical protein B0T22DRAFT_539808 [Podospora appendiculata]